jgi:hypothetical protein
VALCLNCQHDENDHHGSGRWETIWVCTGGRGTMLKPVCMCSAPEFERVEEESEKMEDQSP